MPLLKKIIPYRPSNAWMFAVPDNPPRPPTPVDCVEWCKQFIDDPAAVADITQPKKTPPEKVRGSRDEAVLAKNDAYRIKDPTAVMADIHETVREYRVQSLAHFAVRIWVELIYDDNTEFMLKSKPKRTLKIRFSTGFTEAIEVTRICRPELDHNGRANGISVLEKGHKKVWTPLITTLGACFPPNESFVTQDAMKGYWDANGKVFDWTGLPTELKENVIQHCITDLCEYRDLFNRAPAFNRRFGRPHRSEVVQKVGEWKSLLRVSSQLRAITLRLLFNGCNAYPHGFCMTTDTLFSLSQRIRHLDRFCQLAQTNGVPSDRVTAVLAQQYINFPKIYPQLDRFATFKHGIRKLCLQFDFISHIYFFKVTAGNVDQTLPVRLITCDVLEQLPHLNQLVVDLPTEYDRLRRGWWGPELFHDIEPCPRTLHQLIYEQVALRLAAYKYVTVRFFLADDEKQRFIGMRESAQLALQFTKEELAELYDDDEGGVMLDEEDLDLSSNEKSHTAWLTSTHNTSSAFDTPFFPPRCSCEDPCDIIFRANEFTT